MRSGLFRLFSPARRLELVTRRARPRSRPPREVGTPYSCRVTEELLALMWFTNSARAGFSDRDMSGACVRSGPRVNPAIPRPGDRP